MGRRPSPSARHPDCFRIVFSLEAAFLNEASPNRLNGRLGLAQRGGPRVHRAVAQDEIVPVREGRAENEFGIGPAGGS